MLLLAMRSRADGEAARNEGGPKRLKAIGALLRPEEGKGLDELGVDLVTVDEGLLEVVGELLRLLRLRQQALAALVQRKQSTVDDLLPRLLQARQLVEARFLDDLQVADVAGAVALSEYYFARLFKAAFSETLYQFVKRLRLDEARHRLLASNVAVTELGLQVGYSSLSSFIHAFRRRFGLSPAQYRTQWQNEQE